MKKLLSFALFAAAATVVAVKALSKVTEPAEEDEEVRLIKIDGEEPATVDTVVEELVKEPELVEPEKEEEPKEAELPLEELVEELVEEPTTLEEPVEEPEEVVEETPVEEVQERVEETPIEEPVEEEVPVEEPVEEETVEETPVEEVTEEPVVDEELPLQVVFPGLSEKKIASVEKQVGIMLDAIEEVDVLELQHYIAFQDLPSAAAFESVAEANGYIPEGRSEGGEYCFKKVSECTYDTLLMDILGLANDATKYGGIYKGWAINKD